MNDFFDASVVARSHRGIYGIIRRGDKILLIKKARGPYTGLYDLPGGSPEAGETSLETLAREIKEETGCDLVSGKNEREVTILFSAFTVASGEKGCMQHTGVLFDADVAGEPATTGDGLDSNGAVWVDVYQLSGENATPFALMGAGKEVIALADEDGRWVDVGVRGEPRADNRAVVIAAVLIFRTSGKLVLCRVSPQKRVHAGKWSYSAAGHVSAGELCREAALREMKEETGVTGKIESDIGRSEMRGKDGHIRAFHYAFKVVSDDPIIPDPQEISEVREFTIPELKQQIQQNPDGFHEGLVSVLNQMFG